MRIDKNQAGDTIIEVLIAVVVVGLAIAISYGIASRSLRLARQSQERVEAVKLTEGQVERLKSIASGTDQAKKNDIFDGSGVFCIDDNNNPTADFGGTYGQDIKTTDTALTGYPAACQKGLYKLAIDRVGTNEFQATTRWFSLGSNTTETMTIRYRLYP